MNKRNRFATVQWLALAVFLLPCAVLAADPEIRILLKDHRFEPSEVRVPAGKKVKLMIENQDPTAEEFESHSLNREKVIAPGGKAVIFIGPLQPGKYPFVGEFHEATAQGVVIVE